VQIKQKLEELEKNLLEVGKKVYESAQQTAAQAPPSEPGREESESKDDGYVDAEYKIVDDEEGDK